MLTKHYANIGYRKNINPASGKVEKNQKCLNFQIVSINIGHDLTEILQVTIICKSLQFYG